VPTKKNPLAEDERAKRIREAARDHETSDDPALFERAFAAVTRAPNPRNRNPKRSRRRLGRRLDGPRDAPKRLRYPYP
jgi:hypothetical protein